MAKRFLLQVDLETVQDSCQEGLDLQTISYLDHIYIVVSTANLSRAKGFLRSHFDGTSIYCNATSLGQCIGDVISLLDNGASKVFVSESQFGAVVKQRLLADLSRLIVSLDNSRNSKQHLETADQVKSHIQSLGIPADCGVAVNDRTLLDIFEKSAERPGFLPMCYVRLPEDTLEHLKEALAKGHVAVIPAKRLTIEPNEYPQKIPAWLLVTSIVQSDRADGFFPTVVTDERGVCLGLVYSNYDSIVEALKSGRGVYWSRSRNKLWIKGAESGDTQDLIRIRWDCDADALQFVVRQKGDGTRT